MFRDKTSKSIIEPQSKTSQEHIDSSFVKFLPSLKDNYSIIISAININHPPTHSSSKSVNHLKEDLPSELIPHAKSSSALKNLSNHLPYVSSQKSKKISGPKKPLIYLLTKLSAKNFRDYPIF